MATTRLRIDVRRPVLISDISRFLLSLHAFGIAAEMAGPTGDRIAAAVRRKFAASFHCAQRITEKDPHGSQPESVDTLLMQALGTLASTDLIPRETVLRISDLRTGSIEVVIEDAIEGVSSWFQRLAKSLYSLAPGQNGELIRTTLEQMKKEAADPITLASVSDVAIAGARTSLENMQAAAVVDGSRVEQTRQAFL